MREEMHSFDTHEYIKIMKSTGLKETQAEAIVQAIKISRDFDLSRLATKEQLKNTEEKLVAKIDSATDKAETRIIKWVCCFHSCIWSNYSRSLQTVQLTSLSSSN